MASSPPPVTPAETLLLTRSDVLELLSMADCVAAVEEAFRLLGEGKLQTPGILGTHVSGGGFHIKAGVLPAEGTLFYAVKVNANFPANGAKHGLPTIQGAVLLFDAERGTVLAIMDSIEITALRTGAATAVAAKYLARPDSASAAIIGCGVQGRVQLRALQSVLPLRKAYGFDIDPAQSQAFSAEMSDELGIDVIVAPDLAAATLSSDIIVTCTTSKSAFLAPRHIRPGTFIAAVGADNEEKQELDPALLANNRVVADLGRQAVAIGELHHAIEAGLVERGMPVSELGAVVAGKEAGRESAEEITVFDSTGMALQDVAAAYAIYRRAQTRPQLGRIALNRRADV